MDKESGDIKTFSAEDIQRYHANDMLPKERHALEKAALEDPFLSDAIEGYANATNASEDIKELKKTLLEKETNQKIIPISARRKGIHPAVKVAAIVLVIAGAGWLINHRSYRTSAN